MILFVGITLLMEDEYFEAEWRKSAVEGYKRRFVCVLQMDCARRFIRCGHRTGGCWIAILCSKSYGTASAASVVRLAFTGGWRSYGVYIPCLRRHPSAWDGFGAFGSAFTRSGTASNGTLNFYRDHDYSFIRRFRRQRGRGAPDRREFGLPNGTIIPTG